MSPALWNRANRFARCAVAETARNVYAPHMTDTSTVLTGALPGEVQRAPFPHLLRPDALPRQAYERIEASFPEPHIVLGRRGGTAPAVARLSALQVLDNPEIGFEWRDFFAAHVSAGFWSEIVRVFGTAMRETFPDLEVRVGRGLEDFRVGIRGDRGKPDVSLECQFVINPPSATASTVKTPHVDKRQTIFAGLFYMRDAEDRAEGGDLELYTWKQAPRFLRYRMILPDDVAFDRRITYAANTLACFVNSPRSVHGVSQRMPSIRPRRYINLIAELPFHAFAVRPVSIPARIVHWQQARRIHRGQAGRGS
jgi:hypothetical protein